MKRPVTANDLNCAIGEVLVALGAATKAAAERRNGLDWLSVVAYLRDTMRRAASVADALYTQWAEAAKQAEEGSDA